MPNGQMVRWGSKNLRESDEKLQKMITTAKKGN